MPAPIRRQRKRRAVNWANYTQRRVANKGENAIRFDKYVLCLPGRPCITCGFPFIPYTKNEKFCTTLCRKRMDELRNGIPRGYLRIFKGRAYD